jgi:hypothetical protein
MPASLITPHDHLPLVTPDGFYTCASGGLGHGPWLRSAWRWEERAKG